MYKCYIFVPMKNILVYFLAILICLPLFSKVSVVLVWKINQKYIIENLCVNKTKPKLKCNGKCHLMSNLNDIRKEPNAPMPEKVKELKLQPIISVLLQEVFDVPYINMHTAYAVNYDENYLDRLSDKSIFVPPDNSQVHI